MKRMRNIGVIIFIVMSIMMCKSNMVFASAGSVSKDYQAASKYYESGDYQSAVKICNDILNSGNYINDSTYKKINKIIEDSEKELKTIKTKDSIQGEWFIQNKCINLIDKTPVNHIEFHEDGTCNIYSGINGDNEKKYGGTYSINGIVITCTWIQSTKTCLDLEYSETGILYGLYMGEVGKCCSYIKNVNVSEQIDTANEHLNKGEYLAAIQVCDSVLSLSDVSTLDVSKITAIKTEAENNYNIVCAQNKILGLWKCATTYIYFGKNGFCMNYEILKDGNIDSHSATYTIKNDVITVSSDIRDDLYMYEINTGSLVLKRINSSGQQTDVDKIQTPNLQENIFDGENLTYQMEQLNQYINDKLFLETIDLCSDLINNHIISMEDRVKLLNKKDEATNNYRNYVFEQSLMQINDYDSKGMYLEIMQICDDLTNNYPYEITSRFKIEQIRRNAEINYNNYLWEMKKNKMGISRINDILERYNRAYEQWLTTPNDEDHRYVREILEMEMEGYLKMLEP